MNKVSPELRARLDGLRWTGHCIRLDDDTLTIPGKQPFTDSLRFEAIDRLVRTLMGDVKGLRVADMGSFEGGFAVGFAAQGAEVLGIEARDNNMAKLRVVEEHLAWSNLGFEQADVKDFTAERYGRWDVVLALGVVYHLDQPVEWLHQIAAATDVLVVDTSYAPPDDEFGECRFADRLGPLETVTVGGQAYEGRWFREYAPDQDREPLILASWSNNASLWLTKESLVQALLDAGFASVVEHHDRFTLVDCHAEGRSRVILGAKH